jgi:hypothetical protein
MSNPFKPTFDDDEIVWPRSAAQHYGLRLQNGSCRRGRNALHWLLQTLNTNLMSLSVRTSA